MKESLKSNTFIAICGNHINSTVVGKDFSYINLLTKQTGYRCLAELNNTCLKISAKLVQEQIDLYNPEIVLLKPDYLQQNQMANNTHLSFLQLINKVVFSFLQKRIITNYFKEIRSVVANNPDKHFIILSPIPASNKYLDKIKRIRGRKMNNLISNAPNATYINLMNSIKKKKRFFVEASYLNRFGHTLLARLIAQKSGLTLSATQQRRFAA